jgi:hydroxymethylbilane synthase
MRGNVTTRIQRLDRGEVEALILAAAALDRLDLAGRATEHLDEEVFCPAPGQGTLALECRAEDARVARLVAPIHDGPTFEATMAERAFLARIGAGCRLPVGCHACRSGAEQLVVRGVIAAESGHPTFKAARMASAADAAAAGASLAEALLEMGAREIVERLA